MSSLAAGNLSYRKLLASWKTRNLNTLYGISLTNQTGTVLNSDGNPSSPTILDTTPIMSAA